MLLHVFPVLKEDNLAVQRLEHLVELDDDERVDDNVDPQTGHLVLLLIQAGDLQHQKAELLHAKEPNDPGNCYSKRAQKYGAEEVLPWSFDQHGKRLFAGDFLDEVCGSSLCALR